MAGKGRQLPGLDPGDELLGRLDRIIELLERPAMPGLPRDLGLAEVADLLGMSERWVADRVREGAAHQRYGRHIKFNPRQVEALRARFSRAEDPVTPRRRKRRHL